jgi:hypothetical protein
VAGKARGFPQRWRRGQENGARGPGTRLRIGPSYDALAGVIPNDVARWWRNHYHVNGIRDVGRSIATVLAALDAQDQDDRTVVVVTADHDGRCACARHVSRKHHNRPTTVDGVDAGNDGRSSARPRARRHSHRARRTFSPARC